jgi:hypothetical protein
VPLPQENALDNMTRTLDTFLPPDIQEKTEQSTSSTKHDTIQTLSNFLNKFGPSFAIPVIGRKDSILFNSEVWIERAFYALRWKQHLSHLEDRNLNIRIPFHKKNCPLPDNIDSLTEAKMTTLKNSMLQQISIEWDKLNPTYAKRWNKIKKFCKTNNLAIINSDKTKKNIIIPLDQYNALGEKFLRDSKDYRPIAHNNCQIITKKANDLMKHLCDGRSIFQAKDLPKLRSSTNTPSQMFFLIKDHKKKDKDGDFPLRPVASIHNTPVDKLDWIIQQIIQPLLNYVPAHLPNAERPLEHIDTINKSNILKGKKNTIFSLDVVNLYPSIPLDLGINAVMKLFLEWRDECNLLDISPECLEAGLRFLFTNYEVTFNNKVYIQTAGAPMGARSSVALAIITMNHIETIALQTIKQFTNVLFFGRYVDDILFICSNEIDNTDDIETKCLETFNRVHKAIQFTIELSKDNHWLPFLDFQLRISNDHIYTKWYQKEVHSGNLLHAKSNVSLTTKKSFGITSFTTILKRCNDNIGLNDGCKTLINELRNNGYDENFIHNCIKKACAKYNQNHSQNKDNTWDNCLPIRFTFLSNNLNTNLKKTIRDSGLPLVFVNEKNNKVNTLGARTHPVCKPGCPTCPLQDKAACLNRVCNYTCICKTCGDQYIGKSDRRLYDRIIEHHRDFRYNRIDNSAIAYHSRTNHTIEHRNADFKTCYSFKNLKCNVDEPNNSIAESLLINKLKPSLNRRFEDVLKRRRDNNRTNENNIYKINKNFI